MSEILVWGNPRAFFLLFVILSLPAIYFLIEKRNLSGLNKSFGPKVAAYLTQSLSSVKRRWQLLVQLLGLSLIVVALARPQTGARQQEIRSEGVELLILADVSDSMRAEDVKPSRLAQMKIELSKLLELMPGNKIGIIAFAGSSALLSPLTTDPNALRMYIESLDTDSVSTQGTNFEVALSYAKEAFERGGVTQDSESRSTRVILVVSDGEDQEQGALQAAKTLADEDVRIFTMAYGTEKGGAIPVHDAFGSMTGFKKDSSGQTVLTQVRGKFLSELAEAGKGKFYFAYFNGDHLRGFVSDVDRLEKTQFESNMMTQYDEKFTWPLLAGFILLMVSFLINDRRSEETEWKGKYE